MDMISMKVKDVMRRSVVTGFKEESVLEIAKRMKEKDVGSVVIIEKSDSTKPIGIVTREDITIKVVAEGKTPSEVKAEDIMSSPVITCTEDDDLMEVANTMNKYGYERLPVVDKNGNLIGIVSIREILAIAPGLIEVFVERLKRRLDEDIGRFEEEKEDEVIEGECELCGNYSEELRKINDMWICAECAEKEGFSFPE